MYVKISFDATKCLRKICLVSDHLMKAEDRKVGRVSFSTYLRYCKAAGGRILNSFFTYEDGKLKHLLSRREAKCLMGFTIGILIF